MLDNCFRFAPRDSIPGLIAKICKYLKDHPGWSEKELEDQIKKFISATGVESFNGRTGAVTLDKNDVNNLKIASAYFAGVDESIDSLNLVSLYNQGVRFVFTDFNSVTSGYNLAFVLDYLSASGDVVYYPMSTGSSGGGNIVSVNGKTGVVELSLADIVGTSGVQVKICTATEFMSTNTSTWNTYYNEGYRIVGVVNSDVTAIDHIYILKQDENNHTPIGLSTGASDAYTPTNPPPYPVTSVNGKTGSVIGLYDKNNPPPYPVNNVNSKTGSVLLKVVDVSNGNSTDENAYMFIDESDDYPDVIASDSSKLGGQLPSYYAYAEDVSKLKSDIGDAWASGKTYAVGNYCISGNQLYKCKTAHTAGSAFDAAYWDEANVSSEISSVKNAIESNYPIGPGLEIVTGSTGEKKSIIFNLRNNATNGFAFIIGPQFLASGYIHMNGTFKHYSVENKVTITKLSTTSFSVTSGIWTRFYAIYQQNTFEITYGD